MSATWTTRVRLSLSLVAAAACWDDPVSPAPGVYDVVIEGSTATVGAVLFLVQGGAVDSVESIGYYTASAPYSGVATQVLVAGSPISGSIVRIHVPDRRVRYEAVLLEAAQTGTHQLLAPGDYSLSVIQTPAWSLQGTSGAPKPPAGATAWVRQVQAYPNWVTCSLERSTSAVSVTQGCTST